MASGSTSAKTSSSSSSPNKSSSPPARGALEACAGAAPVPFAPLPCGCCCAPAATADAGVKAGGPRGGGAGGARAGGGGATAGGGGGSEPGAGVPGGGTALGGGGAFASQRSPCGDARAGRQHGGVRAASAWQCEAAQGSPAVWAASGRCATSRQLRAAAARAAQRTCATWPAGGAPAAGAKPPAGAALRNAGGPAAASAVVPCATHPRPHPGKDCACRGANSHAPGRCVLGGEAVARRRRKDEGVERRGGRGRGPARGGAGRGAQALQHLRQVGVRGWAAAAAPAQRRKSTSAQAQ
jgi:hypothetical protein